MISKLMAMILSQGTFLYIGPIGVSKRPKAAVNKNIIPKKYNMPPKGPGALLFKK
jgi:hypothetical protein